MTTIRPRARIASNDRTPTTNRRTVLGAAAVTVGLAVTGGALAATAQEATDDEEAVLDIVDYELVDGDAETYLAATVENDGTAASGWITLEADWYDSNGDHLDADRVHLGMLEAGTRWLARVYYDGEGTVADFTLEGRADFEPLTAPTGLEVLESELEIDGDEVVVTGRLGNETGDTQSTVDVIALLYDEDGDVLGDAWVNESDVEDEEARSFECVWYGRDRAEDVVEHTVVVTDAAF